MRRRSDRSKAKPTQEETSPEKSTKSKSKSSHKDESPEKPSRRSHRHTRRRRKSSSSSDESVKPNNEVNSVTQPLEVQVQDIELPQGEIPVPAVVDDGDKTEKPSEEAPKEEWKEDKTFWDAGAAQPAQESTAEATTTAATSEKEESSLWKVQSANGAGGEIQKLKICRQRPTESPEIGESSLRKRLSRGNKESRSTDDSTQDESEKEIKKSKHRTRTSSKNSPLVSPTVVCDLSEDSPTKIKIINVSNINAENKAETVVETNNETVVVEEKQVIVDFVQEDSQISDTLDIALPIDESPPEKTPDAEVKEIEVETKVPDTNVCETVTEENVPDTNEDSKPVSPKVAATSPVPSPKKDAVKSRSNSSSSGDSDASENDKSSQRKVKKKRRRELQSTIQRKSTIDQTRESSDSEDEKKKDKKEAASPEPSNKRPDSRRGSSDTRPDSRRGSSDTRPDSRRGSSDTHQDITENKETVNDKESEAVNSIPAKEDKVEDNVEKSEPKCKMPRKRRWGSTKTNRTDKKPIISISTDSLKNLIPDAKPVPADELQLSVEEEEGQLDDDDDEDEVVAFVAKEEEKELERERQRDERLKREEREKELEERRKRLERERLEKSKPEPPKLQPTESSEKAAAPRKIHLLSDDVKKLARSPSPPRRKPTNVLFITHLVRPFTVLQLKNLLLRTGTIAENGFWIDKIKSKCYVEYTTEDAAVETRHALHGVRWPTSNPKTLVVEFATHDDLVMAQALSEEPEVPRKAEPLNMVEGWVADQARIKEQRTRRTVVREWDVGKPEHPDEILEHELKIKKEKEQERRARKERPHRTPTPEPEAPARKARRKDEDAPAKLLDDLFRKTKTSPCIYWLPLTQEQIAVKEEIRRQHMAEHERRMAELKKAELARRERERRSRK